MKRYNTTEIARGMGMSAIRLNKWLISRGIIIKNEFGYYDISPELSELNLGVLIKKHYNPKKNKNYKLNYNIINWTIMGKMFIISNFNKELLFPIDF